MQLSAQLNYTFDDFSLDVPKRQLLRGGELIPLNPKAFDLLLVLVENAGQLLSKDVIFERVWHDQFVEESNLTVHMSAIRKALGEQAKQPRYITTISGEGYSFVGEVRGPENSVVESDDEYVVETQTIGRIIVEQEETEDRPLLLPSAAGSNKKWTLAAALALVAILGVGGYFVVRALRAKTGGGSAPAASMKKLTSSGRAGQATLSPDSKLFAFSIKEAEKSSLWLGYVDGGEPIQIRPPADTLYLSVRFSPDGANLYYVASENFRRGDLYRIPVLGGAPEKVQSNIQGAVAFAPDGKRLATIRNDAVSQRQTLVVTDLQGGNEQSIAEAPADFNFAASTPVWSPNGDVIAIGASNKTPASTGKIFMVDVVGKSVTPIESAPWSVITGMTWFHDGSGLVVVAREKDALGTQIWQVAYPGGESRRVVTDLNNYGAAVSLSADDKNLLAVQVLAESNIWSAPAEDLTKAKQITFGSPGQNNGWYGLEWLRDGRIIYTKQDNNNISIWSSAADGTGQKQLIPGGGSNTLPSVPDNEKFVVFQSNRSGNAAVWRSDIDGGNLIQLTGAGLAGQPRVSPDGKWVVYVSDQEGGGNLLRVSIDGGEPQKLTDTSFSWVDVSPDSRSVAGGCDDNGKPKLCILSIDGGPTQKIFDIPRLANFRLGVRWTPDGQAITYRDWANGIWRQNIAGGEPALITGLPEEKLYGYGWSPDGKRFAYTRGAEIADVVMISGLSPF